MYCRSSVALRLHSGVRHALLRAGAGRGVSILIGAEIGLYRDGLARSLGRRKGIRVVGTAADPESLVRQTREYAPDVVLFDVAGDGASYLGTLFEAVPHAKVIVLGLPETEADVVACVEAGVAGFVASNSSLEELVGCIRAAARDEVVFSPRVAAILLGRLRTMASGNGAEVHPPALTSRQLEILQLIDLGLSNKEIARRLCIELSTVKNHVHQILDKLQVRSRSEAAASFRPSAPNVLDVALLACSMCDLLPALDFLPI